MTMENMLSLTGTHFKSKYTLNQCDNDSILATIKRSYKSLDTALIHLILFESSDLALRKFTLQPVCLSTD